MKFKFKFETSGMSRVQDAAALPSYDAVTLPFENIPGRNANRVGFKSCTSIQGNANHSHSLLVTSGEESSVRALTDAISIKTVSVEKERSKSRAARSSKSRKSANQKRESELKAQREFKQYAVSFTLNGLYLLIMNGFATFTAITEGSACAVDALSERIDAALLRVVDQICRG